MRYSKSAASSRSRDSLKRLKVIAATIQRTVVLLIVLLNGLPGIAFAQTNPIPPPPQPPLDPLLQLMIMQPSIEVATNLVATAQFDPPAVHPGAKAVYRVTFNALSDSVQWPETVPSPAELELRFSARGQILVPTEGKLKPQTAINYHVRAAEAGSFIIPDFVVSVYGQNVTVPSARLEVSESALPTVPQSLQVEFVRTNVYIGEPVTVRVIMRAAAANVIQGIQDLRLNGEGFLWDQTAARQSINMIPYQGSNVAAYTYETTITPLHSGNLTVSAQGFTAGNRFAGPIIIQGKVSIPGGPPQFQLIDSDRFSIHARPLPRAGELPGFNGAIGKFLIDPPRLSTNTVRIGEPVKLFVTVRGEGNMARLVPPVAPASPNWQVFAATPGNPSASGSQPALPGTVAAFTYTLIPLTTNIATTPVIPFSCFDPESGTYVDLSIPSLPIAVLPGETFLDSPMLNAMTKDASSGEQKLKLSSLATDPGRTATTLVPLQQQGWFITLQFVPALGFLALWQWDRRRRFLEQHPDILVRRRARRQLAREKRKLQEMSASGDELGYAGAAVSAMRIAAAPHFPAEPRALVSRDIIQVLNQNEKQGEVVRRIFAAADAADFSAAKPNTEEVLALHPELTRVLAELEAKL